MQHHVKALEYGDKEISQLPGEIENDRLKAAHWHCWKLDDNGFILLNFTSEVVDNLELYTQWDYKWKCKLIIFSEARSQKIYLPSILCQEAIGGNAPPNERVNQEKEEIKQGTSRGDPAEE